MPPVNFNESGITETVSNIDSFADKVAIVTGSSSGIGEETARAFAERGARVVLHGRDVARLQKVANDICRKAGNRSKIHIVIGSMEVETTATRLVDETIEKFQRIDFLVNNAGIVLKPDCSDPESMENLDYLYSVNLRGPVLLTKLAMPYLHATGGSVVNISSITAIRSYPDFGYYGVIKAALDHQTRLDAQKYAPRVRVNVLNVGAIKTDVMKRHGIAELDDYAAKNAVLGRIGMPEDVANAVLFLSDPRTAAYITGASLVVDGGCALKMPPTAL